MSIMYLILYYILVCFSTLECIKVKIYGPGLKPNKVVMPARYFFVEFTDVKYSHNISNALSVEIKGKSLFGSCRHWIDKLDCKDGSFIVRYKLYESCNNFILHVKYKDKNIGKSPYIIKGTVIADKCQCPVKDLQKWLDDYSCPEEYEQINEDLKLFKKVEMNKLIPIIVKNYHQPKSMSICHYVIKSNELFRKCYGEHVGFNMFSDNILLSLMRKVLLPDTQFFMNLGDWPLAKKSNNEILPIFSWCGSNDTYDIVMPTYDITEATLENMGRVMLDLLSVQGNINTPWDQKIDKAFWRGRDSRLERIKLIDIAKENPELLNASLTNFFFYTHLQEDYGPKQPHISFFNFFDYKYQVNIDGTVAAYRFPFLLAGDSLVLKQESPFYEHFYHKLKPNVHYIPFKRDLSDLKEKILWAKLHDIEAKIISRNGRKFVNQQLLPKDIICYHALLLKAWSSQVTDEVQILKGMEKVKQSDESNCDCGDSKKDEL